MKSAIISRFDDGGLAGTGVSAAGGAAGGGTAGGGTATGGGAQEDAGAAAKGSTAGVLETVPDGANGSWKGGPGALVVLLPPKSKRSMTTGADTGAGAGRGAGAGAAAKLSVVRM